MPGVDVDNVGDVKEICSHEFAEGHTEVPATVFEDARRKIFHLMQSDSFVRFRSNLPTDLRQRKSCDAKEDVGGDDQLESVSH